MKDLEVMKEILDEKHKEIIAEGNPPLDEEGADVMEEKRIAVDQPASEVKQDPMR